MLSTVNPNSSGTDQILFTVTDPDNKSASDDSNIRVIGKTEPFLDMPAKVGFVTGAKTVIDLNSYVYDPDFPNSDLSWVWSGNTNIEIDYEEEYLSYIKPLYFTSSNGWTGWERVYFAVNNPFGGTTVDSTTVFSVPEDGSPVVGGIEYVSVKAGYCDSLNLDLDNFYYDHDTPG